MIKTAILGSKIAYTRSPAIHKAIADVIGVDMTCDVVDIVRDDLETTVNGLLDSYDGFFVTKPFKTAVKQFVGCTADGAVNVVRSSDGAAANTDTIGFLSALNTAFVDWKSKVRSALVIGAGGAAWAVSVALRSLGVKVYVINRTLISAAKLCRAVGAELYANQPVELAVNCTSVTDGDILKSLCILPSFEYAFDAVYTSQKTPFMRRCEQSGGTVANGEDMLVYQAIAGDAFILRKEFPDAERIFAEVKRRVFAH